MRTILGRLAEDADLIVVDSPPVQAVTDAVLLSSIVDGTLYVIDAGRTRRGAVRRGREALAHAGGRVLGVTLNRLAQRSGGGTTTTTMADRKQWLGISRRSRPRRPSRTNPTEADSRHDFPRRSIRQSASVFPGSADSSQSPTGGGKLKGGRWRLSGR